MRSLQRVVSTVTLLALSVSCVGEKGENDETKTAADNGAVTVIFETSMGRIVMKLDRAKAPRSVSNFVSHVKSGFYDNLVFHRVIADFMIQAGRYNPSFVSRSTRGTPIQNESYNGLLNQRGAVAMARTNDPQSALDEFYINVVDNPNLDPTDTSLGYAVFGMVVEGMDIVDAISKVQTTRRERMADVPVDPVIIERAYVESPETGGE